MKKLLYVFAAGLLLGLGIISVGRQSQAQDPVKVGPHIYTQLFENDQVRVSRISFKPGDTIGTHSHPNHFLYVLRSGKIKISHPDGTSQEIEPKIGEVLWLNAETHSAKNVGKTEFRGIVVDLKEPAKTEEHPTEK